MAKKENTAKWAVTVGYLPIRTSAYTSETYMEYCSTEGKDELELLSAENAINSASTNDFVFTNVAFKGSSRCRTEVGSLVANTLKDGMNGTTIDDAYVNSKFALAVNNTKADM